MVSLKTWWRLFQTVKLHWRFIEPERIRNFLNIFIFLLFLVKGIFFLDPDFGWRLKAGEIYLKSGIPTTDPFTYTMPSFPWVDHAWVQSVIFAALFSVSGKIFLAFFYALVVVLTLLISFYTTKKEVIRKTFSFTKSSLGIDYRLVGNLVFILSSYIFFVFYGIRVQVISWLMLAILLRVIFAPNLWKKWRKYLPIYLILWVNIHGSFALGIVVLFLVLILKTVRLKKIDWRDYIIIGVSFAATFINPYGKGVWQEVISSISDTSLRWSINEWMPLLTMPSLPMVVMISLSLTLVFKQRRIFKIEELVLYIFLFLQAIASRRHLPLWIVFAMPMTVRALAHFYQQVIKIKGAKYRFKKVYNVAWWGMLALLGFQLFFDVKEIYAVTEKVFYPQKALAYLGNNLSQGEIFSTYGWGGYLIWRLPEKKVFIDGRMPSWKGKLELENELNSSYDTYNDILSGKIDYTLVFDKFGIDTVLWRVPKPKSKLDDLYQKAEQFLIRFGREKNDFDFLGQLERDGWKKAYEDEVAVILIKTL